ncbi:uncharacterized protein LOC112456864, partial [Temnothorax curvispinosus]|uniref:Uncharacterized protein LOC112456864 n=1 Tax=Temnothorax curvispinosus TaxID=300111 RepID=A0A6J1PZS7_9HYME
MLKYGKNFFSENNSHDAEVDEHRSDDDGRGAGVCDPADDHEAADQNSAHQQRLRRLPIRLSRRLSRLSLGTKKGRGIKWSAEEEAAMRIACACYIENPPDQPNKKEVEEIKKSYPVLKDRSYNQIKAWICAERGRNI